MNGIKCKIIISEPWNFRNSIDNGNYLRGHVRQLTADILLLESDTEELILISGAPYQFLLSLNALFYLTLSYQ
jgi:hypothetical protein